mmetsp:Transcript_26254/g.47421  ORF Transcript_26254/g.47421 Transcript_26254/m.47421 type:complete len:82 (+) Transcript_26254:282-527(+)
MILGRILQVNRLRHQLLLLVQESTILARLHAVGLREVAVVHTAKTMNTIHLKERAQITGHHRGQIMRLHKAQVTRLHKAQV